MEYTNENILKGNYNTKINHKKTRKSWTSKLCYKMKNHKIISTTVIALIIFSTINLIMVYNFMKILQTI